MIKSGQTPSTLTPLDAADRIGRSLCHRAYWDRDARLCNWVGPTGSHESRAERPFLPAAGALGHDVYGGTAGIALFVAQSFALRGDPLFRSTALGAIARSLRQLDRLPPGACPPLSFFLGHLGVLFAARRVGVLTGEAEIITRVPEWLGAAATATDAALAPDWISGSAGAIPALLALGRDPDWSACREVAVVLGETLCRTAVRRGTTWLWNNGPVVGERTGTGTGTAPPFLTGLAHGAAGIGVALLELHAATGRHEFLEAALGAFAYVDEHFNPAEGNWLVLSNNEESAEARPTAQAASAWCHGAPGIALARLRAAVIDPVRESAHSATARVALAATLAEVERSLALPRCDTSLCHGLAGLGDVLLTAGERLDLSTYRDVAATVGRTLIERHADAGDWPSGLVSTIPCPSLMYGSAGTGYFFLRLHDPAGVPSVLLHTA